MTNNDEQNRTMTNKTEQCRTKPNTNEQYRIPTRTIPLPCPLTFSKHLAGRHEGLPLRVVTMVCPYASPTTRRHLGFATKMPDEHFYKSIMNKCVFAWLSSRQARLFLYSRAKLLIIIRFTKFPCIFFPPISPCFAPFLPISRHYPHIYIFLTISMGGKCFARVRCFARVKCCAR